MENKKPTLFEIYPNLEGKIPWIPLMTHIPTNVDRLTNLEAHLKMKAGKIYIKRDDKDHIVYGGNKLRKFEFIFGNALKKKKKGILTIGGIGTNHGLACAIVARELKLKCDLFLFPQPLTWHVQRSLLLYDYFGAKLHYNKKFTFLALRVFLFQFTHPKYYSMLPGGSPLFGLGTSLGTLGFINAIFELHKQIEEGNLIMPDAIFLATASAGTTAGLIAGIKLLNLPIKVYAVRVSMDWISNPSTVIRNANKAIKYLRKHDKTIPNVQVEEKDFEFITGYLGSEYGAKTVRGQGAIDVLTELEGKDRDFRLDTTYTGKAMAAMIDFLNQEENKNKVILFWDTYNSNDLDMYLRETNFNYKTLPNKFHKFFEEKKFQCWQLSDCPEHIRRDCPAYLNQEYRFWKVAECKLDKNTQEKNKEILEKVIILEDA